MKKPSRELSEIMAGTLHIDNASEAVRSTARLPIYNEAVRILSIPTIDARRAALAAKPDLLRPSIEKEMMRLYEARKAAK